MLNFMASRFSLIPKPCVQSGRLPEGERRGWIPAQRAGEFGVGWTMKGLLLLGLLLALAGSVCAQKQKRRGPDRAPAEGAAIPRVEARTPDGSKSVKLSEPERLTVLVFGSHT